MNKYLINSGQSEVNDDIKKFCKLIPNIIKIEDLKILDKEFYKYFKKDNSTQKFSRNVIDIFNSKTYSGCSDIGLMMASILREKNIPTIYVETAKVEWLEKALNHLPESDMMLGHIFLELFIENKWYLYDPTFHIIYDGYNKNNINYPRGYIVFNKGLNANELGVFNTKDERKQALEKISNLDIGKYKKPNYLKIDLI